MKTFISAAAFAVVAEAILWALASAFGRVSMNGRGDNLLGVLAFCFHWPATLLAACVLGLQGGIAKVFVIFAGAAQFFLLWLLIIAVARDLRRKHDV